MNFEEIYHVHKGMVFNLALNYVLKIEDAEEITQDVFVTIHSSISSFNHQSSLSTWIYKVTINKCLDFIKAKKRKKRFAYITSIFYENSSELKHDLIENRHPGILLEDKEDINSLFMHINKLPFKQKTAIILQKIENKSQQEVAEIMNISPKAVAQLIQRAKQNLSIFINKP